MNLTEKQWEILIAVMDRIVPEDDYASASQAGVDNYFKIMFTREYQPLLPIYHYGLDSVSAESQARFGADFAKLSVDQQDSLLYSISEGNVQADWTTPPRAFFSMLVNHVQEGFYSDPENGGNRDGISWKMTGFSTRKPLSSK